MFFGQRGQPLPLRLRTSTASAWLGAFFSHDAQLLRDAYRRFFSRQKIIAQCRADPLCANAFHAITEFAACRLWRGSGWARILFAFLAQAAWQRCKARTRRNGQLNIWHFRSGFRRLRCQSPYQQRRVFIKICAHPDPRLFRHRTFENAGQHGAGWLCRTVFAVQTKGHLEVKLGRIGSGCVGTRGSSLTEGEKHGAIWKYMSKPETINSLLNLRAGPVAAPLELPGCRRDGTRSRARFGGRRSGYRRLEFFESSVPQFAFADRRHNGQDRQHHVVCIFSRRRSELAISQARFLGVFLIAKHLAKALFRRGQALDVQRTKHFDSPVGISLPFTRSSARASLRHSMTG